MDEVPLNFAHDFYIANVTYVRLQHEEVGKNTATPLRDSHQIIGEDHDQSCQEEAVFLTSDISLDPSAGL